MNRYGWRRWHGMLVAVVILALAVGSVPAAAGPAAPGPVSPVPLAAAGLALPEGPGVTPLTPAELQAVDGEMIQFLIIGARLTLACLRSPSCLKTVAKMTGRAAFKAAEVGGAIKFWWDIFF
ncbi:MAG: hypothetical protein FWJ89_08440 [Limnochorda sp.]|uniref:hypothetical protein n=1 Tax=Limnochorda sp. TaxID=1940279 RepID=UPI0039C04D69